MATKEQAANLPEDYGRFPHASPVGGRRRKRKTRKRRKRRKRKTKNMRKKKGGGKGKNKKIGKKTSKKKPTQRKERRVRFIECKTDANCDGTKICRGGICVEQREIPRVGSRAVGERWQTRRRQRRAAPPQLTRSDSIRYQVGPAAASAAAAPAAPSSYWTAPAAASAAAAPAASSSYWTAPAAASAAAPPQLTTTDSGQSRSWGDIERLLGNPNRGGRKTKRRR